MWTDIHRLKIMIKDYFKNKKKNQRAESPECGFAETVCLLNLDINDIF